MAEQEQSDFKLGPQEQAERTESTAPVPSEEVLERTSGIRQGDPNDARYYGSLGLPDSGFGTGQTDYGGSEHGIGASQQNYQPGYGIVPGYGAMGTQGTQGAGENHHHISRDERIKRDVLQKMSAEADLIACNLEVEVINSIVTLRGKVPNFELKRLTYALIEPMREVRDIINQVEVTH